MTVEALRLKPKCVWCGSDIDPSARKCLQCAAYQDGRECVSCGATLPRAATRCTACKKLQSGAACRSCGDTIEHGTRRCGGCGAWQNWRRFFSGLEVTAALLVSLVSVIGATSGPVLNAVSNRSRTSVRIIGDGMFKPAGAAESRLVVRVLVVNNGRKPSMVKGARITFHDIDAAACNLTIANRDDSFILPDKHVYLQLATDHLARTGARDHDTVCRQIEHGTITIDLAVEETDWRGNFVDDVITHTAPATRVRKWMNRYVSTSKG
jgi:hypothetical protein